MSTRASKRKAGAPPASKPAAKRGDKGGRAAAAAAAGKGAAAEAPSGPPLYAVRCERHSNVVQWDEETFVDCYDEDEGPRDEVEGCAEAWDGVWLHDAAQRLWQHPAVPGSGRRVVSTNCSGQLTVFERLEAAKERAAAVFRDMLEHSPEWMRPAPAFSGQQGSDDDEEEEGEEDSEEEEEEEEESEEEEEQRGCSEAAADVDLQNLEQYSTVLPDGRVRYERQLDYYCDPWNRVLKNRVKSWVHVEVVPVARGG